jgi:hypothetical protein
MLCQIMKEWYLGKYVFVHLRWLPFSEHTAACAPRPTKAVCDRKGCSHCTVQDT